MVQLANVRDGEGFIAVSPESRKRFWLDRARTAAIAKHTNAFKINEDVVIPLDKLGEYSNGIDRLNIELSIQNKLKLTDELIKFMNTNLEFLNDDSVDQGLVKSKKQQAVSLLKNTQQKWVYYFKNLDESLESLNEFSEHHLNYRNLFELIQAYELRISWKKELKEPLEEIFSGREFTTILQKIYDLHKQVLKSRVFIALHMHAGDGNVHTNIPVNSLYAL